jgi:hypothetical protein
MVLDLNVARKLVEPLGLTRDQCSTPYCPPAQDPGAAVLSRKGIHA